MTGSVPRKNIFGFLTLIIKKIFEITLAFRSRFCRAFLAAINGNQTILNFKIDWHKRLFLSTNFTNKSQSIYHSKKYSLYDNSFFFHLMLRLLIATHSNNKKLDKRKFQMGFVIIFNEILLVSLQTFCFEITF